MKVKKVSDLIEDEKLKDSITKEDDIVIDEIIDIFLSPKDIPDEIKESFNSLNYDLSNKEINRGDTVWVTALIRKKGTNPFNSPAVQGILKLKVMEIYYGLQHIKKVLNQ